MKKSFLIVLCVLLLMCGCSQTDSETSNVKKSIPTSQKAASDDYASKKFPEIYDLFKYEPETLTANGNKYVIQGRVNVHDISAEVYDEISSIYNGNSSYDDFSHIDYLVLFKVNLQCYGSKDIAFSKPVYRIFGLRSTDGSSLFNDIGFYIDIEHRTAYTIYPYSNGSAASYSAIDTGQHTVLIKYDTAVKRGYIEDKKDYSFGPVS